ncbi:hypothetical protein [Oxobacter pfennigii]|nr:hypothetical protein [Oxobacter pfennigii]
MSFIAMLSSVLATVTYNEKLMSSAYYNKECAYYIAEAGIERALTIIDREINKRLEEISYIEEDEDFINLTISMEIRNFFSPLKSNCFDELIKEYEKASGKDSAIFPQIIEKPSYYDVKAELDDIYKRTFILTSTGYYSYSMITITARYLIQETADAYKLICLDWN